MNTGAERGKAPVFVNDVIGAPQTYSPLGSPPQDPLEESPPGNASFRTRCGSLKKNAYTSICGSPKGAALRESVPAQWQAAMSEQEASSCCPTDSGVQRAVPAGPQANLHSSRRPSQAVQNAVLDRLRESGPSALSSPPRRRSGAQLSEPVEQPVDHGLRDQVALVQDESFTAKRCSLSETPVRGPSSLPPRPPALSTPAGSGSRCPSRGGPRADTRGPGSAAQAPSGTSTAAGGGGPSFADVFRRKVGSLRQLNEAGAGLGQGAATGKAGTEGTGAQPSPSQQQQVLKFDGLPGVLPPRPDGLSLQGTTGPSLTPSALGLRNGSFVSPVPYCPATSTGIAGTRHSLRGDGMLGLAAMGSFRRSSSILGTPLVRPGSSFKRVSLTKPTVMTVDSLDSGSDSDDAA